MSRGFGAGVLEKHSVLFNLASFLYPIPLVCRGRSSSGYKRSMFFKKHAQRVIPPCSTDSRYVFVFSLSLFFWFFSFLFLGVTVCDSFSLMGA
jgi:hypothetical protein